MHKLQSKTLSCLAKVFSIFNNRGLYAGAISGRWGGRGVDAACKCINIDDGRRRWLQTERTRVSGKLCWAATKFDGISYMPCTLLLSFIPEVATTNVYSADRWSTLCLLFAEYLICLFNPCACFEVALPFGLVSSWFIHWVLCKYAQICSFLESL